MITVIKRSGFSRIIASLDQDNIGRTPGLALRDHSALKHLIGDRSSNLVDEKGPHLGIALKKSDNFLFFSARWSFLAFFHPHLLPGRVLIFLIYFLRCPTH